MPFAGGVTKTGNGHARRLLIEAAWHHRPVSARRGATTALGPASPAARARGQRATGGCTTVASVSMPARSGPVVANTAIARELAGWCWSLAVMPD